MFPTNGPKPNLTQLELVQATCEARFLFELEIQSGFGRAYMLMKMSNSETAEIMKMVYLNAVKDVMEDYLDQKNVFSPYTRDEWIKPNEDNPMQKL